MKILVAIVIVVLLIWAVCLVMAKKEYEMAKKGYSKVTSVYNKKDRWIR